MPLPREQKKKYREKKDTKAQQLRRRKRWQRTRDKKAQIKISLTLSESTKLWIHLRDILCHNSFDVCAFFFIKSTRIRYYQRQSSPCTQKRHKVVQDWSTKWPSFVCSKHPHHSTYFMVLVTSGRQTKSRKTKLPLLFFESVKFHVASSLGSSTTSYPRAVPKKRVH